MVTNRYKCYRAPERDQENNNTGFGKVQNNKHRSAEGEQHTVRSKLKEAFKNVT